NIPHYHPGTCQTKTGRLYRSRHRGSFCGCHRADATVSRAGADIRHQCGGIRKSGRTGCRECARIFKRIKIIPKSKKPRHIIWGIGGTKMAIIENDYAAYVQTPNGEYPIRDLDAQEKISKIPQETLEKSIEN